MHPYTDNDEVVSSNLAVGKLSISFFHFSFFLLGLWRLMRTCQKTFVCFFRVSIVFLRKYSAVGAGRSFSSDRHGMGLRAEQ